jgi:hypothetical protein
MRRQLVPAGRLLPGDVILEDHVPPAEVVRLTGSPGRKSPTVAPLLRVFTADRPDFVTMRADQPVAIEPRITRAADQLAAGDLVRLPDDTEYRAVVRVTGSPGRRSESVAPLLRVFVDGLPGFVTVRSDFQVSVRPPST